MSGDQAYPVWLLSAAAHRRALAAAAAARGRMSNETSRSEGISCRSSTRLKPAAVLE